MFRWGFDRSRSPCTGKNLTIETRGRGTVRDHPRQVQQVVERSGVDHGLCHVFVHHTSRVADRLRKRSTRPYARDLEHFAARLGADGDPTFVHDSEGPGRYGGPYPIDPHAHIADDPRRRPSVRPGDLAGSLPLGTSHRSPSPPYHCHGHRRSARIELKNMSACIIGNTPRVTRFKASKKRITPLAGCSRVAG